MMFSEVKMNFFEIGIISIEFEFLKCYEFSCEKAQFELLDGLYSFLHGYSWKIARIVTDSVNLKLNHYKIHVDEL